MQVEKQTPNFVHKYQNITFKDKILTDSHITDDM